MPIYTPGKVTLAKGQPVPNDPNFAFNSLLLHGDGANGSTVITDSSGSPKTVTAVGNAQISTAIADPFGNSTGVLAFDGAGSPVDRVVLPFNDGTTTFGSANFTVEGWVYRNNTSDSWVLAGQGDLASAPTSSFGLFVGSISTQFYTSGGTISCTSPSPAATTWAHVAWTRSGGTVRSFLNGSLVGSNASFGTLSINQGIVGSASFGGSLSGTVPFNGYMDDIRITKGVARYVEGTGANAGKMVFAGTNTLALPTAPFPDF